LKKLSDTTYKLQLGTKKYRTYDIKSLKEYHRDDKIKTEGDKEREQETNDDWIQEK
jgi:hypothetical protein